MSISFDQKMWVAGEWLEAEETIEVFDPGTNECIAVVPSATAEDMNRALSSAEQGAKVAEKLSVHDRMDILHKVADDLEKNKEEFATIIATEGSKTINEARGEAARTAETIRISAEEARRLNGETISFDQSPGNKNRFGYYFRFPVGVVAAITPFNDPLNLVAHKIGPAIAAGNAVILKPAAYTPLSALRLTKSFIDAGLPKHVLNTVTGRGREIGNPLVESPSVRMVSFTGGLSTGEAIAKKAGLKKLAMELGSNSPVLVFDDANVEAAAEACVSGAFAAAGQNCLGVQRIYVQSKSHDEFKKIVIQKTSELKTGNKMEESTDVGPLITEKEAERVEDWIQEAVEHGAQIVAGGKRRGTFLEPTVLVNVPPHATIAQEEVFGPVVLLDTFQTYDEAIKKANNVNFGLQAGIFTSDVNLAVQATRDLHVGGVMVNDSTDFRVDAMPFGGVKGSGIGREGVRASIEEMSEPRVVCFNIDQP
ncbi:aldehyde dehydrogenase family protein [Salsuginibacillus kocurii]|uniref:aldehyde dehydrogenase family protein n=1 Tax=Salsuginibacillus kocurii TaxID=427078 RepID=UPI0003750EA6|nr:aldehyde dehydrogenase family protein [Salsuginibacillus kocurii]